jgi:hypothetical protein
MPIISTHRFIYLLTVFLYAERGWEHDKVEFVLKTSGTQLTALRKANISSCPESIETIPDGTPPVPTLPSAKTFVRSLPPSVSVSNWKLEAIKVTWSYNHEDILINNTSCYEVN